MNKKVFIISLTVLCILTTAVVAAVTFNKTDQKPRNDVHRVQIDTLLLDIPKVYFRVPPQDKGIKQPSIGLAAWYPSMRPLSEPKNGEYALRFSAKDISDDFYPTAADKVNVSRHRLFLISVGSRLI